MRERCKPKQTRSAGEVKAVHWEKKAMMWQKRQEKAASKADLPTVRFCSHRSGVLV